MAKTYKTYLPEQDLLLPPSLRDWLPENHLAYCVSDVVDQLDLSSIESVYEEEDRGQPPYHPRMMTKILVYGYCVGVFSSRRIQKRLAEDVAFRVLAAGNEPDFRTLSDFRKNHLPALKELFQQVLRLVLEVGGLKLGRVALDGSKVKANASKHKAMSYGRMGETEKRLRKEVQELLKRAEAVDKEEDQRYGRECQGEELPAELQRRETRIARIREAQKVLEERAREKAESEKNKDGPEAKPETKAQYNFTDPESRILKGSDGFVQGYNSQVAVEPLYQLVVGQTVTQDANDKQQVVPLIEAIEEQAGQKPEEVLADSGYCSEENLKYLAKRRMEGFVATEKQKHTERTEPCPRGPLPKKASRVERMKRKLQTKAGAAIYARRKCMVEPVFGQIKQARGFRQFLLRGLEKVRGEWALVCMTHNLLKFHKICYG
ncbi:MAG: IS1182 family transposase [Acidobacteria bacterium]|nr:MAG: IS1182 family transposase [Acidobacteriota bacterium]